MSVEVVFAIAMLTGLPESEVLETSAVKPLVDVLLAERKKLRAALEQIPARLHVFYRMLRDSLKPVSDSPAAPGEPEKVLGSCGVCEIEDRWFHISNDCPVHRDYDGAPWDD